MRSSSTAKGTRTSRPALPRSSGQGSASGGARRWGFGKRSRRLWMPSSRRTSPRSPGRPHRPPRNAQRSERGAHPRAEGRRRHAAGDGGGCPCAPVRPLVGRRPGDVLPLLRPRQRGEGDPPTGPQSQVPVQDDPDERAGALRREDRPLRNVPQGADDREGVPRTVPRDRGAGPRGRAPRVGSPRLAGYAPAERRAVDPGMARPGALRIRRVPGGSSPGGRRAGPAPPRTGGGGPGGFSMGVPELHAGSLAVPSQGNREGGAPLRPPLPRRGGRAQGSGKNPFGPVGGRHPRSPRPRGGGGRDLERRLRRHPSGGEGTRIPGSPAVWGR